MNSDEKLCPKRDLHYFQWKEIGNQIEAKCLFRGHFYKKLLANLKSLFREQVFARNISL